MLINLGRSNKMNRSIIIIYKIIFIFIINMLLIILSCISNDEQSIVKELIKIINNPSMPLESRIEAAHHIGKMGETAKEAIPYLVSILRRLQGRELEPLQVAIIDSLAQMGYIARIALPTLTIVSGRSPDIDQAIKRATKTILSAPDERDITSLIKQLGSSDPSQRLRAVDALRRLGEGAKEASAALMTLLDDADYTVRNAAIEALLSSMDDKKVPDVVIRAIAKDLNETNPERKLIALYRLAKIGTRSAIVADAIDKLRNDNDTNIRRIAQEILSKIIIEK